MAGMHLFYDGDIAVYTAGFACDSENGDLAVALSNTKKMIDSRVEYLKSIFWLGGYDVFLSSDDHSNFRFDVATTAPYKGNRTAPKPKYYVEIREYLTRAYSAHMVTHQEADDEIGILASEDPANSIICSKDKDLRMIPGWHDELNTRAPFYVSDPGYLILENTKKTPYLFGTGYAWYCAQLLTGDVADNIPGLSGYGVVKAFEVLNRFKSIEDLDNRIISEYIKMNCLERLNEIKELLWIRRQRIQSI